MEAVWTIEVDGISRKYRDLRFDKKLIKESPTEFTAKVEYDIAHLIDFMDLVEIKRNGTTEWKGFVTEREIAWDEEGRFYNLTGKDMSFILWKKMNEEFTSYAEGIEGFFGKVNPSQLIKLLLRTPRSDHPSEDDAFKYNKSGWGLDASRISDVRASRTSYGDPSWVFLRERGISGWRNVGNPYSIATLVPNAVIDTSGWTTVGASPYINTNDGDTSYIKSTQTMDVDAIFRFENLIASAQAINSVHLSITWKGDFTYWWWIEAMFEIYLSTNGGSSYNYVGYAYGRSMGAYFTMTWDVTSLFDSPSKLQGNQCYIKFVNKRTGLSSIITYAQLLVNYASGGTQELGDEFDIYHDEEETVGIYIESRADEQSYARNYGLLSVTDNLQDFGAYQETDPNFHITKTANHIDFFSYENEDAYVYKDFGEGYFTGYFDHWFNIKVVTDPVPVGHIFGIWAVTNDIDDYAGLASGSRNNLAMSIQNGGSGPKFYLREVHNGTSNISAPSLELTEGTTYAIHIKRIAGSVTAYIYTGTGVLFDTITLTMAVSGNAFRYLFGCLTANNGDATSTDVDLDNLILESYVDLGYVNSNTFRDIIHSWIPQITSHIRIRITSPDASHAWAISQIYLYKAEELDYRIMYEGGTVPSLALNQYIQEVVFDETFSSYVGPLNIPEGRVLDSINSILEKMSVAWIPYEWYMEFNAENTFHITDRIGSDKSGWISFILGENLESSEYTENIDDTFQRVKVRGRGEGQRSDEVSSGWISHPTAIADVKTFIEEVKSVKEIVNKTTAQSLAAVQLMANGMHKDNIKVNVSRDEYSSMTYDVGDDILINDSLIGVNSAKRLYNIRKVITSDGENVTLWVGSPHKTEADIWNEIFARLKDLELSGGIAGDWVDQGKQGLVDPEQVDSLFEATRKEDSIETGNDINDAKWSTSIGSGCSWNTAENGIVITGPNSGSGIKIITVDMKYERILNYGGSEWAIKMEEKPRMEFTMALYEVTEGQAYFWRAGDEFIIGLAKSTAGHYFKIIAQGSSTFKVYAAWKDASEVEVLKEMTTITSVTKYRYIIKTDYEKRRVLFEVWDVENNATYPVVAVRTNIVTTDTVHPLYMKLSSDCGGQANQKAEVFIYHMKIEYTKVNV